MPGPMTGGGKVSFSGTPTDMGPTNAGRELSDPTTVFEDLDTPQEMDKKPMVKDTAPAAPADGRKAGDFKGTPENV